MRVLVGFESSGKVRDAFIARGHQAMSCDLLPTDRPGPHYQGDVRDVWDACWDLAIFHPECTHLSVSGARHFAAKWQDGRQAKGIAMFMQCIKAPVPRIAVENPICIMSRLYRKPDQTIQPWQFGHGETKATCLWLKGLPRLIPTHMKNDLFARQEPVEREQRIHKLPPSPDRWKLRSETYDGIAEAMAAQWGRDDAGGAADDRPEYRSALHSVANGMSFPQSGPERL